MQCKSEVALAPPITIPCKNTVEDAWPLADKRRNAYNRLVMDHLCRTYKAIQDIRYDKNPASCRTTLITHVERTMRTAMNSTDDDVNRGKVEQVVGGTKSADRREKAASIGKEKATRIKEQARQRQGTT